MTLPIRLILPLLITALSAHAALAAPAASTAPASTRSWSIKHRFLAVDESRGQLLYVDQANPSNDWTLKLPGKCRDVQLVGDGAVMLSLPDGFIEYALADRKVIREVKGLAATTFARRLPGGNTLVGGNQGGVTIHEVDRDGKVVRKASFPAEKNTRLGRLTADGTVLFGADPRFVEVNLEGKTLRSLPVEGAKHVYQALRRSDGHYLVAGGYGAFVAELDAEGKILRKLGGKDSPHAKEFGFNFFAGFQVIADGHVVVCNWTGHGAGDSVKGHQLVQFDPAGQVVWTWHDPQRAGSLHGVIVLDELDTKQLNDDTTGVLRAARRP